MQSVILYRHGPGGRWCGRCGRCVAGYRVPDELKRLTESPRVAWGDCQIGARTMTVFRIVDRERETLAEASGSLLPDEPVGRVRRICSRPTRSAYYNCRRQIGEIGRASCRER